MSRIRRRFNLPAATAGPKLTDWRHLFPSLRPTRAPDAPAKAGYELAIATPAQRVPVVAPDGTLIGVVGVTDDLAAFCGADQPGSAYPVACVDC